MNIIKNSFFDVDASLAAKKMLGKIVCHKFGGVWLKARIIETESYYLDEKGSHASLGFTEKRKALFMDGGTIYMYYARGGDSLNISCKGEGNAVLVKSGYPYEGMSEKELKIMQKNNPLPGRERPFEKLCSGQTLLCKSLGLKVPDWDGKNFDHERFYMADDGYRPETIINVKRLGIPKGRDEHLMLRFIDKKYVKYCTNNPLTKKAYKEGEDYSFLDGEI